MQHIFKLSMCINGKHWIICVVCLCHSFYGKLSAYCLFNMKLFSFICVTYWPSTEPSIKRCTCIDKRKNSETGESGRIYRNITLTCGRRWIRWWWQMRTPTGSRWVSDNYITRCHRRLGSVQLQFQLEIRCQRSENQLQTEGLGSQWPTVEQPSQNAKEVLLWSEELGVNM